MGNFTLREYTQEEYKSDMEKLLKEKGLKKAVKKYLDEIDRECSGMSYIPHRTVQEFLCDILFLCDLYEKKNKNCTDCILDGTDACSRGSGRAVDDEICDDFLEEYVK